MKSFFVVFCMLLSVMNGEVLLKSYPMIISHDAATGELYMDRDHVVADWGRTQSTGLVGQLNCGSRSFDYRPYLKDNVLIAHHGPLLIHKEMRESVTEIVNWTKENSNELVIMIISHCDSNADSSSDCINESIKLLSEMNVYTITNCDDLATLTYEKALELANTSDDGSGLIAIIDCVAENYDSTINCYGKDFICYDSWPENTTDIPWSYMKQYMSLVTKKPTEQQQGSQLYMAQAHWQSNALGDTLGTLHNSSLLADEYRSGVNSWVVESINANEFEFINLLELDNVCDKGNEIAQALKTVYL